MLKFKSYRFRQMQSQICNRLLKNSSRKERHSKELALSHRQSHLWAKIFWWAERKRNDNNNKLTCQRKSKQRIWFLAADNWRLDASLFFFWIVIFWETSRLFKTDSRATIQTNNAFFLGLDCLAMSKKAFAVSRAKAAFPSRVKRLPSFRYFFHRYSPGHPPFRDLSS